MSKQGNSSDSFSISCPFLRKKDAKDIVIIIGLFFQYFLNISAPNIVLCIQYYLILSIMPLPSYQMNYPTLIWFQFGCYGTALYLIFYIFIIVWSCRHYYKIWQLLGITPHCWLNAKLLLHTAYTQTLFLFSQTIFLLSYFLICSFFHTLSSYLLISDLSDSRIISHWRISGPYLIGW